MCGICGYSKWNDSIAQIELIQKMTQAIQHRGPDFQQCIVDRSTAMGHVRLSILDLSAAGNQPMQRKHYTIVYNGEVYNYKQLRSELIGLGCVFSTDTDTEVVLQAYITWGVDAIPKLNGMFAFAIWNSIKEEWIFVRDRMGIKPLYFYSDAEQFIFSSEIKSIIIAFPGLNKINTTAFCEYLWYGNALDGKSFFNGISKLQPAHYLIVNKKGHSSHEYWRPEQTLSNPVPTFNQAKIITRQLLEDSVKSQLVSDVPVGVLLSGGIDSSAITALASKHYSGSLNTYTILFDYGSQQSDIINARKVSKHFGTKHYEYRVETGQLPQLIETLMSHHDEPFADSANIPLYLIAKQLHGEIKVLLQGDGGDELFAGYRRYNILQNLNYWRNLARISEWGSIFIRNKLSQRMNRMSNAILQQDEAMVMALLLTVESPGNSPITWLKDEMLEEIRNCNPFEAYKKYNTRFETLDITQRMLWTDTKLILADTFLEKVDKSTMAHGIEVRVPLLDNRLVDFVMPLPADFKVHRAQKKYLLRSVLRGIVPDAILDAPKQGFGVPYEKWLQHNLYEFVSDTLLSEDAGSVFNTKLLAKMLRNHQKGVRDYGFALWKILHFIIWKRRFKMNF